MATAMTAGAVRRGFRPSFFFWMTVAMACFIFSGFGLTYWVPMATGKIVGPGQRLARGVPAPTGPPLAVIGGPERTTLAVRR